MQNSSSVIDKPPFARWLFDHDVKIASAAASLGVSTEQVRRYTRPFGDARRQIPTEKVLERIVFLTDGAVTAADFYPRHLRSQVGVDQRDDGQQ